MKLYEMARNYTDFMAAVEEGLIPEEAVADTLEAIEGAFEDKADNIACLIKSIEAEAKAIKEEAAALAARAKAKENKAGWLRSYLAKNIPEGMTLETPRNKLTWRKSEAVMVQDGFTEWAKDNASCYVNISISPDKAAIKNALKSGAELPGAYIETRQNLQIK